MPRTGPEPNSDILTVRIPPSLKAALAEIARQEAKTVGELLRELIRDKVRDAERRAFEAEARRQCLVIVEAARDPNSDEAQVMREIEAELEELGDEWK
jgi:predicted DNA-binding protein